MTRAILLAAAALAGPADDDGEAAVRLRFMQERLGEYVVAAPGEEAEPFALRAEPILRWSNPVSGKVDGGVFLWERGGRPMVIEKVYISRPHVAWGEAIQSLAPGPVVMTKRERPVWAPDRPGLSFTAFTDAPTPSEKPNVRLVQMRGLARRFEMSGLWGEVPQPWELRLAPEPIHRYSAPEEGVVDGALFAFVQEGTNPEGLLVIEAFDAAGATGWRYAVSRLTKYEVRARYRGAELPVQPRLDEFPPSLPFRHDFHWFSRWPFGDDGA